MKYELKQQKCHSNVSITQQAIHEAAKVKNDSKIIKLCETLDSLLRNYSTITRVIAIILIL